jgi:hypothetical protein
MYYQVMRFFEPLCSIYPGYGPQAITQPSGREKDAISFLKDSFPGNFPSVKIVPITEAEIKCAIHFLTHKNSSGRKKREGTVNKQLCNYTLTN